MDTLQKQILELDRKVEQIHEIVERLSSQIAAIVLDKQNSSESEIAYLPNKIQMRSAVGNGNGHFKSLVEHKDILVDDHEGRIHLNPASEQALSSDIQIRRLTAQLTAAYNRIATLEEQLLACRMSS
jgi:hypothetical protein